MRPTSSPTFFEEICKLRAARRIWARMMKDRYGAKSDRSWFMKTHVQTAGCSLTEQQPMNNIVRVAYQAMAAALGGCQSLHTDSMDETLGLPTEQAVTVALATDDPAGRRIVLILSRRRGFLGVEMSVSRIKGVSAMSASFTTSPGEAFHGFGGRRESTDLRGLDMKSWVLDYRYPDASTGWYSPYPGFISSRGYGVLLGGDRISRWRMASDSPRAWRVSKQGAMRSTQSYRRGSCGEPASAGP